MTEALRSGRPIHEVMGADYEQMLRTAQQPSMGLSANDAAPLNRTRGA